MIDEKERKKNKRKKSECVFCDGDSYIFDRNNQFFYDPALAKAPKNPKKLSFSEKQGTPARSLSSVLAKAPQIKPVSVGFFGGKLNYSQLSFLPKLFVKIIIRGKEGDYHNWETIREWAADLSSKLSNN